MDQGDLLDTLTAC